MTLLAVLLLAACTDDAVPDDSGVSAICDDGEPVDDYFDGISHTGAIYTVAMTSADPAPPDVGVNTWTLLLSDADGTVDGAEVTIRPWMPLHGHGTTPLEHAATGSTDGIYTPPGINLFMSGLWVVSIDVDTDTVAFRFCLEG